MKKRILSLTKKIFLGCIALSWWIELPPSILLFGEYEYPKKEDYPE